MGQILEESFLESNKSREFSGMENRLWGWNLECALHFRLGNWVTRLSQSIEVMKEVTLRLSIFCKTIGDEVVKCTISSMTIDSLPGFISSFNIYFHPATQILLPPAHSG